jgi:hypothetical protein
MARLILSVFALTWVYMAWITPGRAEGALAVGLPERGPSGGFVYGMSVNRSLDEAQSKAMDICRGIDRENNRIPERASEAQATCRLISVFQDKCTAVAYNGDQHTPSTAVGWAIGSDTSAAETEALAKCEDMRKGAGRACRVDGMLCDGSGAVASGPVPNANAKQQEGNAKQQAGPAAGEELAILDLYGRWCPNDNAFSYTFSQKQLHVVFRDGKTRDLTIKKVEYDANDSSLQIFWLPDRPGNSTSYTMSPDRQMLIQMPQTEGDKGPRRELHRC